MKKTKRKKAVERKIVEQTERKRKENESSVRIRRGARKKRNLWKKRGIERRKRGNM